ncbi:MAG: HI0074 family nucleotidyltransferase substrate-binding subunit [Chlamydiota bacterium]
MSLFTTIRWQQRLINLRKAFSLLTQAVSQNEYNELEKAGLIQQFEFCFELSWKTLKDYLGNEGVSVDTPRDVIKQAFSMNLLSDVNIWIDALEKRNLLSHAYEKETALLVISLIKEKYFLAVKHLVTFFDTKTFSSSYGLDLSVLLQLLQQLTKYIGIEEIILFGSRAMGNFKSTSDIDLCLKGTLTEDHLGEIKTLLEEGKVPYKVDVILYDSIKDPAILEHIKCFGKKIYP